MKRRRPGHGGGRGLRPVSRFWEKRPFPRPSPLLYGYIAAEFLAPLFAAFAILYGIFFLVQLVPLLEVVLALRIGFADFIRLNAYLFPHMLLYIIPMASMAGVIIGFSRLASDREILAFKACGVSLRRMLPPVLVAAALIAAVTGYFSVRLTPLGQQAMHRLTLQLAKEKIDRGVKPKEFTEALGDLVIYVDDIDEHQTWQGVYVLDMRDRDRQPLITMAQSGRLRSDMDKMQAAVLLEQGAMHSVDDQDNQVLRFRNYELLIPLQQAAGPQSRLTSLGRSSMTQTQLLEAAKQQGWDSKMSLGFRATYHNRLAMPVGCFILTLIGLPLALQAGPGRRAVGVPLGLGVFVLYYVAVTAAKVLCEGGRLPMFGMWLPNILFFLFALYFLRRVDQERPLLPEKMHAALVLFWERRLWPLLRRIGRGGRRLVGLHRRQSAGLEADAALIRADARTRDFHLPECARYDAPHSRIEFKSVAEAEAAGFHACEFCAGLLLQGGAGKR